MRSVPGLLSVFLIAAGVACAELPPDLPPASPLPFAPGPVIGGTIKGNPAAGIVPVKDLIEANRKDEYIPMAEPIPGETGSSAPLAESIPNAEPIPGETNLHAPVQPAEASLAIPSTAFSPVPVPQHETRVAILGYHDFSRTLPATEMQHEYGCIPLPDAGAEGVRSARHLHEGISGMETGGQTASGQMRHDHHRRRLEERLHGRLSHPERNGIPLYHFPIHQIHHGPRFCHEPRPDSGNAE